MEDFFGDSGETAVQQDLGQGHFQSQDNGPDDQFEFSQPSNYIAIETVQQPGYIPTSPDMEAIRKIQEEQIKIQQQLRQKSNIEYEEKQKRRDEGRKQYEQFLAKKQRQTASRKAENVQKQKQLLQRNAKLSQEAGWKKVAANVPLKQGEHKGVKDITRMRESIINKRSDQSN